MLVPVCDDSAKAPFCIADALAAVLELYTELCEYRCTPRVRLAPQGEAVGVAVCANTSSDHRRPVDNARRTTYVCRLAASLFADQPITIDRSAAALKNVSP